MIKSILGYISELIGRAMHSDLDVMSYDVCKILSNKCDTKLYNAAIRELHNGDKDSVTFTTSYGEIITLIK